MNVSYALNPLNLSIINTVMIRNAMKRTTNMTCAWCGSEDEVRYSKYAQEYLCKTCGKEARGK